MVSTQANILHDSPLRAEIAAPRSISPFQLYSWSILRELWDNHSLVVVPAVVAVLILLGFFFGPFGLKSMTYVGSAKGAHAHMPLNGPYYLVLGLMTATVLLVGVFYSADALYTERRDRSILFWKSLPVSDLTTVLAKASISLLVLPLIAFVIAMFTQLIMAIASSVVLLQLGDPVAPLWSQLALPRMWLWLFVHLITVSALWYAPFYAWLLFVSSWATRAPLLWGFLPPLALSTLEFAVFHTWRLTHFLQERLAHGNLRFTAVTSFSTYLSRSLQLPSVTSFNTPELWLGLLSAVLLLAAAVQMRRYRGTV